ncbi:lipoprotein [Spiroplasma endosymbiont of Ammophila pubescens]|uniref:lipoprotein n=1 Tax=Spiroplasma endosymbiont of Ammophila pubescens TaxID=3066315 RepID=UPI0032B222A8
MKKLLSVLGAVTLVGTGVSNIVTCHTKTKTKKEDTTARDIEVLSEIQNKAVTAITEKIKEKMYVDSGKNNLAKIYAKVDNVNSMYQLNLNNAEDKKLANYFINDFTKIFETVNYNLQNEYSNYFPNSMPLNFDEERSVINVNFVNVEAIKNKFPVDINPEPFSAVRIDFKAVVSINFKTLFSSFEISTIYNVTENTTALKVLSDRATTFLIKNIQEYFNNLENADFSTNDIFKPLYDNVQWDFSEKTTALDERLKFSFKEYISSKKEFQNIEITYNAVSLVDQLTKGTLSVQKKGYDIISDSRNIHDLELSQWFKYADKNGWKTNRGVTESDFVNFYKNKIGTGLNINETDYLSLGTFKINLTYINIYGICLSGYAKNNDGEDLMVSLQLSKAAIDKKLNNWGKIIIAFWKYITNNESMYVRYGVVHVVVPKLLFQKLLDKNQRDGLKGTLKVLVDSFKSSEEATDLEDIELFNLISHPLFERVKGTKNSANNNLLEWVHLYLKQNWAALFTFGEKLEHGLYYSFVGEKEKNGVYLQIWKQK